MKAPRRHRVARALAFAPLMAGSLGLLLHFTVRDGIPALAILFYGLPPAVVVTLFTASVVLFVRLRRRRWAVVSAVALIVAVVVWVQTDYVHANPPQSDGDSMRLVVWNLARPSRRSERFIPTLKEVNGDIMVLVESGRESERRRQFWQSHFPHHHVVQFEPDITVLSRYPITGKTLHVVKTLSRIGVCDLTTPFGDMTVFAVDIDSTLTRSRKPAIDRVYEIARSKGGPVVIMGDFNTPHTSLLFEKMRRSFQQAFEQAGDGWITTWPALCPALALDHIWLSPDLVPVRADVRRTFRSDHALVMADVKVAQPKGPDDSEEAPVP